MSGKEHLKLKFINWVKQLSDEEIAKLMADVQNCFELDRCFQQCLDVECDYYNLLLLLRTPSKNFRQTVAAWLESISEEDLSKMLEKALICGEQSFCLNYCGARDCSFKFLIQELAHISALA